MRTAIISLLGLVCAAGLAMAHSGATGIVKERMDGMGRVANAAKQINGGLRSNPLNRDDILQGASVIASEGGTVMTDRFPEAAVPKVSEALPVIWENWDRFGALADAQSARAKVLAARAQDPSATQSDLAQAFDSLRQVCSDCHAEFRVKK